MSIAALLHHSLLAQADSRPDGIALVMAGERVSYAELLQRSCRLARQLREAGCQRGDRVCLLIPKSVDAIVAILAALMADCVYVPLDPASPAPRLAKVLDVCEHRCLVAAGSVRGRLLELAERNALRPTQVLGWIDAQQEIESGVDVGFTAADVSRQKPAPIASANRPDDPAYILFTSGSTGDPKGVVITHANVHHFIDWAVRYFDMRAGERISGHPPLHFDLSVFDIFGALAAGAELHLVPTALNLRAPSLAQFIRDAELDQWFSVPSVLTYLATFDVLAAGDFPSLKRVIWCGETLPTPVLMHWMKRLPHASFTNLYGPTEATIASSFYTVPACPTDERKAVPIGQACDGERLLVLDADQRPCPVGEVGDLYIAGVGLSPGYWRDLEKTEAAFLSVDVEGVHERLYRTGDLAETGPDGLISFHGRADTQIKSRGYRIELGEIEAALHALDDIREAAVVAVPSDGFEGWTICCAYAPIRSSSPAALKSQLARLLPSYMLPHQWREVVQLPKNTSGKVDRRQLREHFAAGARGSVPSEQTAEG